MTAARPPMVANQSHAGTFTCGASRGLGQQKGCSEVSPLRGSPVSGPRSDGAGVRTRATVPGPRSHLRADDATVAGILPYGASTPWRFRAGISIPRDREHPDRY
ncbi:hypothetical protein GCM10023320_71030 [Pseudonocardia adelaidensis]|uniref:Uncharacterized protein n=1 Tax=Pseudonocardia adelaidensis TaxID=648754 RepID=A0ABP9P011_9PSEU